MIGTWIKVTKLFAAHNVEFRKKLDDITFRVAVIGIEVVARTVTARTPVYPNFFSAEAVATLDQMVGVTQLEGKMEQAGTRSSQEINCMMVGVAAQKDERVANPVRCLKTKGFRVVPLSAFCFPGP